MKKSLVGVILLPVLAVALSACTKFNVTEALSSSYNSEPDCGFVQNVYGERISWKNQTPIRLNLHESVPSQFYPAIEAAVRDWERALGRPVFQIVQYGLKGTLQPRQDGVNIIYWMNTWETNRSSEQARTSVYWVGDEIREADVRINAKDFIYYVTNPVGVRDVHLESLLVHELGHVLGLKHKDSGGSVMATYLSSLTVRTAISKTDVDSVRCEY